jgi:hypothetical protein
MLMKKQNRDPIKPTPFKTNSKESWFLQPRLLLFVKFTSSHHDTKQSTTRRPPSKQQESRIGHGDAKHVHHRAKKIVQPQPNPHRFAAGKGGGREGKDGTFSPELRRRKSRSPETRNAPTPLPSAFAASAIRRALEGAWNRWSGGLLEERGEAVRCVRRVGGGFRFFRPLVICADPGQAEMPSSTTRKHPDQSQAIT